MMFDDEASRIFREEATEFIEAMTEFTGKLLRSKGSRFASCLEDTLRTTHNLKGAATSVGCGDVESLAHAFEEVFGRYRGAEGPLDEGVHACAVEALGVMQDSVDGKGNEEVVQDIFQRLASICGYVTSSPSVVPEPKVESQAPASRAPDSSELAEGNRPDTVEKGSAVRVNTSRLDHLMGFIGDLLMFRTRLAERHGRHDDVYKQLLEFDKAHPEIHGELAPILGGLRGLIRDSRTDILDFSNLTETMNDSAKQLRTVPLRGAAHIWRRVVRESSQICNKEVQLHVDVGPVEIDRYVLERITDPVKHILRNAVDHGIESPSERERSGKPALGRIEISASLQGAMIRLTVSDDGAGIDLQRVKRKAIDAGFVSREAAARLQTGQITDLLFRAGFSTNQKAGRISGRGVGLDVVRSQLDELGGSVTIEERGALGGTTIVLSVPVSILSSEGLFVRSGKADYALPVESVIRTLRVRREDLKTAEGKSVLKNEDDPIRVLHLAHLMDTKAQTADILNVVVMSRGRMELGLIVDEVIGLREYVIHALPWNINQLPGINGAILEADGSVALLLDVLHLFEAAGRKRADKPVASPSKIHQKVLLVDDSLTSRTIQRAMLKADGYNVTLAADGDEAWRILQNKNFNMVVSDVQMPNMDGFELTRRIRETPSTRDLPVILVTGLSTEQDRAKGVAAGADDYLVKGTFDQNALLDVVSRYLGDQ